MADRSYGKVQAQVGSCKGGNLALVISRIVICALAALCLVASPVYALDPPDNKQFNDVEVYEDLAEEGDMLILFQWEWTYSANVTPETTASDSIMYRLYDTDGTTEITAGTPFVFSAFEIDEYDANGYQDNVGAIYFNAADNMTWGQPYVINIWGVPAFYAPTETLTYTLQAGDYSDATGQEESRQELYTFVMTLCDRLGSIYDIDLKTTSDSGIVLSAYGEIYFRGVISGLQYLCPQLFFMQVYVPEQMGVVSYNMTTGETFTARKVGTDLERGLDRGGDLIGVSGSMFAAIAFFLGCGAVALAFIAKGWGVEGATLICVPIGIGAAVLIGDWIFIALMCVTLAMFMGLVYIIALKRA